MDRVGRLKPTLKEWGGREGIQAGRAGLAIGISNAPAFHEGMPTLTMRSGAGESLPVPCLQLASPEFHKGRVSVRASKTNAAEVLVYGAQTDTQNRGHFGIGTAGFVVDERERDTAPANR